MPRWLRSTALSYIVLLLLGIKGVPAAAQTLMASPNPAPVPSGSSFGQTTISWNAPGYSSLQVHVNAPSGPLFASGGTTGQATTGHWVVSGTTFYLTDASSGSTLTSLRVNTVSAPSVGVNSDGRVELFAVGADGAVYHNSQVSAGSSTWSGWSSLGGFLTTTPTVGVNSDGRLQIFAVGGDNATVWYNAQTTPGGSWSGWVALSGISTGVAPSVARNTNGCLEIFAVAAGGTPYHNWQASPGGSWVGWNSLGGTIVSAPSVGANSDGRLQIFAVNDQMYTNWQVSPSGGWSGWVPIGEPGAATPSVGRNSDGRLEIFTVGSDGAGWHNWQTSAGGSWAGWSSLGGIITSTPPVATNADGRLEITAIGNDNLTPFHNWQNTPGGSWSGWGSYGGGIVSAPSIVANADGRLEIFGVGADNATIYHQWQNTAGGGWSGWFSLGVPATGNGKGAIVQLTNVTRPAMSPNFMVGDNFQLTISGAIPNQSVTYYSNHNGATATLSKGTTDSNGNYVLTGIQDPSEVGTFTEIWYVGGAQINPTLSFSVSPIPTVQLTNVTHPSMSPNAFIGDTYNVSITGAAANQTVSVSQSPGGVTAEGQTDVNGNFTITGTQFTVMAGSFSQVWTVGSVSASPTLSFTVSQPTTVPGSLTVPQKEYIYLNGKVVVIENAHP